MKGLPVKRPAIPLNQVVQGLGWFSIGLGLAELLAPRQVSRGAGLHPQPALLRGYGLREIATGVGLLLSSNPRPWLWGRVAGDVLDVATVATGADTRKGARLAGTMATLLSVGLVDFYSALRATSARTQSSKRHRSYDYGDRSGFPRDASQMRGAAVKRHENAQKQGIRMAG